MKPVSRRVPAELLVWCVGAFVAGSGEAWATGPLGPPGSRIETSQYAIDLFAGPVLSSSRVTGLAGAFAALAEGVEGNTVNAAAPAHRAAGSYSWLDYDLSLGITLPGMLGRTDFDNNGARGFEYRNFVFLTGGLNLQLGDTGLGASVDSRLYNLGQGDASQTSVDGARYVSATLSSYHLLLAHGFWRGQILAGLGLRVAVFDLSANPRPDGMGRAMPLFSMLGYAAETGLLWAPHERPLRAGISWRQQVEGKVASGAPADQDNVLMGMVLPRSVDLPWELEAGLAWEFGARPLNPEWVDPAEFTRPLVQEIRSARARRRAAGTSAEEERTQRKAEDAKLADQEEDLRARGRLNDQQMSRDRWLISASLLVSGPIREGVGTESFFRQQVDRSGEKVSVTPRLGLEAEPWPGRLQFRVGSYLEPARYARWHPRLHGTAGLDLKLLAWNVFGLYAEGTCWAVGAVADVAQGYASLALRVGMWR